MASQASSIIDQSKKPNYLNTYKTEPDEKPKMRDIKELMTHILAGTCEEITYEETLDREICQVINNEVHLRIKPLLPKRYRMITQGNLQKITAFPGLKKCTNVLRRLVRNLQP